MELGWKCVCRGYGAGDGGNSQLNQRTSDGNLPSRLYAMVGTVKPIRLCPPHKAETVAGRASGASAEQAGASSGEGDDGSSVARSSVATRGAVVTGLRRPVRARPRTSFETAEAVSIRHAQALSSPGSCAGGEDGRCRCAAAVSHEGDAVAKTTDGGCGFKTAACWKFVGASRRAVSKD